MNSDRWRIGRNANESPPKTVTMFVPDDDYDLETAREIVEVFIKFLNSVESE